MSIFLVLAFLFFMGALAGWVIELFFRRFVSRENPERKWINPGFLTGPYIPLYGFGLCILFLLATLEYNGITGNKYIDKIFLFIAMTICVTAVEYIAGILCIKIFKVRLWDYSSERWNIQGIICPKFSLIWAGLSAVYYFGIHPHIIDACIWLSENLAFSFFIGMFYGVFVIDVCHSMQLITKMREFAKDNDIEVKFEALKSHIRKRQDKRNEKHYFLFPFHSRDALNSHLKNMYEELIEKIHNDKTPKT